MTIFKNSPSQYRKDKINNETFKQQPKVAQRIYDKIWGQRNVMRNTRLQ